MMNQLSFSTSHLFNQIEKAITALTDDEYIKPEPLLGGATIGQHVRHILEFYVALGNGYQNGLVNYDGRQRDYLLETYRHAAIDKLIELNDEIVREDRALKICTGLLTNSDETIELPTSYYRELMYNLEHTVHHMALIRVGIANQTAIVLADDFGVAASTIKYRKTCAQ